MSQLCMFLRIYLEANIYLAHIDGRPDASSVSGQWLKPRPSDLPSLMRKILMATGFERSRATKVIINWPC